MECAICFGASDDESKHRLQCGHAFHVNCCIDWFRTPQSNGRCPMCRGTQEEAETAISPMTCMIRSRHIRNTVGRRRRIPTDLKRLLQTRTRAKDKMRAAQAEYRAFQREHRDVLTRVQRLRTKAYSAKRKLREKDRVIGLYSNDDVPLPPMIAERFVDRFW